MKRKKSAFDDPVVDEVRAIREKLWREAGGTMSGLRALIAEKMAGVNGSSQKAKDRKPRRSARRVTGGKKVRVSSKRR